MQKRLLTLAVLASLAACGGGGEPSNVSSSPSPTESTSSSNNQNINQTAAETTTSPGNTGGVTSDSTQANDTETSSAILTRLNACPFATASQSPNAGSCLVGRYKGKDIHTGSLCTVNIDRSGTITSHADSISLQIPQPYGTSLYTKSRYTPIAGTSQIGYALLWSVSHTTDLTLENAGRAPIVYTTLTFNFNSGYDGKLLIETVERKTLPHSSTSATSTISCQITL